MKTFIAIVLLVGAVSVAVITAGCWSLERTIMDTKPLPTRVFLGAFTSNSIHVTLTWPIAEPWSYHILAALPISPTNEARHSTYLNFEGTVTVKDQAGEIFEQLSISSQTAGGRRGCNWLRHHELDAIILTRNLTNRFENCVKGQTYDMVVSFSERPPEFESLWLHFLQSAEQKRSEKSEHQPGP